MHYTSPNSHAWIQLASVAKETGPGALIGNEAWGIIPGYEIAIEPSMQITYALYNKQVLVLS